MIEIGASVTRPADSTPAGDANESTDWFVERFADYWQLGGSSRIEGRIAGYLLLSNAPGVSAEELSRELGASRGSVSTHTRRLIARGFVRRVRLTGDRAHYYVMDQDVWGGFLEGEQAYLERQRGLAEDALARVAPDGPAYERVRNMRDYMGWILDNRMLPEEWARFKRDRDAPGAPPLG